jgi:hypothetical protein
MIRSEFLCDHQYLSALQAIKDGRFRPTYPKRLTSGAKALIAVALYGTAKTRALRLETYSTAC